MSYTDEELDYIYRKTNGYCNICRRKLARTNYATYGAKGAWEVDHSNPVSRGGTDYLRNLFPCHISGNRSKKALRTNEYRR